MTKRNEILRNCIKRVESICTNALQSQVEDNSKCEHILKSAIHDITQTATDGMFEYLFTYFNDERLTDFKEDK